MPVVNEFIDEDLIFDLPNVLANMAQGMLISLPRIDFADDHENDFGGGMQDEYLWNYH
ncbi:UNVERIFIED_CONTAM: Ethylene-responsive transcription factor [Sesamum latifolium]|uniref:Ethylene-responsive transcription factor n=1 Tax=Sesamum latifolium TaxID=2727402 RepID=A0AAW2TZT4_9LAMI